MFLKNFKFRRKWRRPSFLCSFFTLLVLYLISTRLFSSDDSSPDLEFVNSLASNKQNFLKFPIDGNGKPAKDNRLLVIVGNQRSSIARTISDLLTSLKFDAEIIVMHKKSSLPSLIKDKGLGKYSLVVFEDYYLYLNMNRLTRESLDQYCRLYNVGIVGFLLSDKQRNFHYARLKGSSYLTAYQNQYVKDVGVSNISRVKRILKPGEIIEFPNMEGDWLVFRGDEDYEPIISCLASERSTNFKPASIGVLDYGGKDKIKRVIFGYSPTFWLIKLALVDAIGFLSPFHLPLERYLQIDIDDIFVGPTGSRMRREDVEALIQTQNKIRNFVSGFTFNLGFSGKFFSNGDEEENAGDEWLITNSNHFNWFSHMWGHQQPHQWSRKHLEAFMLQNKNFAMTYNIPVKYPYSVAPHHSGVYPVHEDLYDAWKDIWGIRVTSTEEYPHLRPDGARRGFIHSGIMVLPRQTCGLFTHTKILDQYPGGPQKLDSLILGGELFFTVVNNPFLVFMTHSTNYALDRLASYTFLSLLKFLQSWTNLKISWVDPLTLAELYFEKYPGERAPVWTSLCSDPRHLAIWSRDQKTCSRLPSVLILGPQKTGSTALYTFMKMHPNLVSSYPSNKTFEEVQFFGSSANYQRGINWYMDQFPDIDDGSVILFEKSATYFDSDSAPNQVHALIPDVKLIVIIIDPVKRAYSWYQHLLAKNDPVAQRFTFEKVIEGLINSDSLQLIPKELIRLRQRCIRPGKYAEHLEKWLAKFSGDNLLVVDGEELLENPSGVMAKIQEFLGLTTKLDYQNLLRFDRSKGFFCPVIENSRGDGGTSVKCLGKSKGRKYPPIDPWAEKNLRDYFRSHNMALISLLTRLGYNVPSWLQEYS